MNVQRFALGASAALQRPRTVPNSRNAVAAKLRFIAGKGVKNCIGKPDTKACVTRRRNVQLGQVLARIARIVERQWKKRPGRAGTGT